MSIREGIMPIEVGAAIFHYIHGVGRVVSVETREWQGESTRYLVVEMMTNRQTMRIPGASPYVRRVLSDPRIIFTTLHQEAQDLPEDYRPRQAGIREAVKSGKPEKVAAAVRDIRAYAESEQGSWTTGGRRLYERALAMLAEEVAVSQDCDMGRARTQITDAMLERPEGSSPTTTEVRTND
jgi:RNA polymerase-interacting CarD/CdnL/TRCF family regulator